MASAGKNLLKKSARPLTKAVIDIGTNSIKLRVVRKDNNRLRTLLDTTEVVRLGSGLSSGVMDENAMRHGAEVIRKLTRLAAAQGARPRLVGTMALRTAGNADDFIRMVRASTGFTVEILSGEEEAGLAWLGATMALGFAGGETTVFDTGGGSTEFIFGKGRRIVRSLSVPLGAIYLTEKFFASEPVSAEYLSAAKSCIRDVLTSAAEGAGCFASEGGFKSEKSSFVIGLGGGVTAMSSVKMALPSFSPDAVNGTSLTKSDVDAQVTLYASRTTAERRAIPGLPSKRADIILASACIVQCVMELLGTEAFRVSINGLRHGLLLKMFKGSNFI